MSIKKVYLSFFLPSFKTIPTPRRDDMGGNATESDDSFLREWTIPEEDRHKYTSQPWAGEYRWFRTSNVICLEQYRRRRQREAASE